MVESAFDECDEDFFLLESKWEAHSPEGKQFAKYFRKHKLPDVKRTMLLGQRVASGLRLDVYTQNASECTNRLIKRGMDIKSMSVLEVAEFLRDMSRDQERNSELACFKETDGVYLHDSYLHLKVSEDQMYGSTKPITPDARRSLLKRIHNAKLIVPSEINVVKETANPGRWVQN